MLVGDSCHAIPPTAAQGANKAVEDAYTLGVVLARVMKSGKGGLEDQEVLGKALRRWERYRKGRVEKVLDLTMRMNSMRLPAGERDALPKDLRWESSGGDGEEMR